MPDNIAPDVMLRCPACGIAPAVFRARFGDPEGLRLRCDSCRSVVTLLSILAANPDVSFPVPPA